MIHILQVRRRVRNLLQRGLSHTVNGRTKSWNTQMFRHQTLHFYFSTISVACLLQTVIFSDFTHTWSHVFRSYWPPIPTGWSPTALQCLCRDGCWARIGGGPCRLHSWPPSGTSCSSHLWASLLKKVSVHQSRRVPELFLTQLPLEGTASVIAAEYYHLREGENEQRGVAQCISFLLYDKSPQIYQLRNSTWTLSHSFCRPGVQAWLNGVPENCSQRDDWAVFTSGHVTGEEFISKLTQVICRIHFHMAVWLRPTFWWWCIGLNIFSLDSFPFPF